MPITIPCPRRPRPGPRSLPLLDPVDALHVALFALGPVFGTVCLLLDRARQGQTCVVVDGAVTGRQVDHVAGLIADVAAEAPVPVVVLVTARPGPAGPPPGDDHARFLALRGRLDQVGVELVDWLVTAGGSATSMAAVTDAVDRWPLRPR